MKKIWKEPRLVVLNVNKTLGGKVVTDTEADAATASELNRFGPHFS